MELGVEQRAQQLFREVWRRPGTLDAQGTSVEEYAGGAFKEQRFLHGRVTQLGYRVRGGNAVTSVLEDGRTVEARVWVGDYEGYEEAETGPLTFTDAAGRALRARPGRRGGVVGGHAHGGFALRRARHRGRGAGGMTTHDENTAAVLLDAGAVLPPGSTTREDADTLTARTYAHPRSDDRRIVRLVPGTLGEAEDLALDFLGLTRRRRRPRSARCAAETLGFPAWALVNDPANGHHALALVKDVERLAGRPGPAPGRAKDGFDELGARLGRAVPHFLPTYYEHVARVFLQAREHDVCLRLLRQGPRGRAGARAGGRRGAPAGRVPGVRLRRRADRQGAARSMSGSWWHGSDPAAAWAQFRQLTGGAVRRPACRRTRRCRRTCARWSRRRAGQGRRGCALVDDLLGLARRVVRAPASFWNAYRSTLAALAAAATAGADPAAGVLAGRSCGRSVEDDEFWLALLAECGAETCSSTGTGTASDVDAADWLGRWAAAPQHGGTVSHRSPADARPRRTHGDRLRELGGPSTCAGRWQPAPTLTCWTCAWRRACRSACRPADQVVHRLPGPLAVRPRGRSARPDGDGGRSADARAC